MITIRIELPHRQSEATVTNLTPEQEEKLAAAITQLVLDTGKKPEATPKATKAQGGVFQSNPLLKQIEEQFRKEQEKKDEEYQWKVYYINHPNAPRNVSTTIPRTSL